MSLVGLVQLTEKLLNQTLQNSQEKPQGTTKNTGTGQNAIPNGNTDTFVPSAQNGASEAGIFQVTQVSLFSAAADLLLAQPKAAAVPNTVNNANAANGVTEPAVNNANTGATRAAAAAAPAVLNANGGTAGITATANLNAALAPANLNASGATNVATNAAPATTAANNEVTKTRTTDTGTTNASTAQGAQVQLADLNASLAALGLSQDEITVVDRVAQLIKDFNPAAFADIINQLQALAQAQAPQAAAAPVPAPAANAGTIGATATGLAARVAAA